MIDLIIATLQSKSPEKIGQISLESFILYENWHKGQIEIQVLNVLFDFSTNSYIKVPMDTTSASFLNFLALWSRWRCKPRMSLGSVSKRILLSKYRPKYWKLLPLCTRLATPMEVCLTISQHPLSLDLISTDLSIRNVAFYNRRLPYISEEELFDALDPPKPIQLQRLDGEPIGQGIPNQLVVSTQWYGWPLDDNEFDDDDIRILDLGSAFHQDSPPEKLSQTKNLRAPETIFTGEFDHRQDLWCVGMMIFHLIFGHSPYNYWDENSLVMGITDVFGDLPPKWERQWEQMRADGTAKGSRMDAEWVPHTKYRVEKQFDEEVHEPELKGLLPVIQGLTKLLPEDRISASRALQLLRQNCGTEDSEGSVEEDSDSGGEAFAGGVEGGKNEAVVTPKERLKMGL